MPQLRPTLTVLSLTTPGQQTAGAGVRIALRIAFESNDPYAPPLIAAVRAYVDEALKFGIAEQQIMRALRLHAQQVGAHVSEPDLAAVAREVDAIAARALSAHGNPARND